MANTQAVQEDLCTLNKH